MPHFSHFLFLVVFLADSVFAQLFAQYMRHKLSVYQTTGQYAEALTLANRLLELKKKLLGDDNPLVVAAMNDVAHCYWMLKKPVEGMYTENVFGERSLYIYLMKIKIKEEKK